MDIFCFSVDGECGAVCAYTVCTGTVRSETETLGAGSFLCFAEEGNDGCLCTDSGASFPGS